MSINKINGINGHEVNNNGEKMDNRNRQFLNSKTYHNAAKFTNGLANSMKNEFKSSSNGPKVAKASKKLGSTNAAAAFAISAAAKNIGRPSREIYKPPGMRHGSTAKSTEDISSLSSPPVGTATSTKPSAAGPKQSLSTISSTSSNALHTTSGNQKFVDNTPSNWRQGPHKLEREKSKSSKNLLNYQPQNGAGGNRSDYDDYYERMRRSQTPPPSLASRQMSCPDGLGKKGGEDGTKLKRQRSFIKDLPGKKKGSFTEKEAGEARMILMALEMTEDQYVSEWITGNYTDGDTADTVGQVLVQLAIEHNKSTKLITKLSSILMECNSGDRFHQGLVTSSCRYFECRERLREEHFRFWLNFVNFLSELHANMGFTYEGELSQILFQLYDYLLQNPILAQLKIEELESLISSLVNVGYDLERQCPDRLTELRNTLRDAFIAVQEPWARKMILLLIELSASSWKLPSDASDYYFQTSNTVSSSS